MESKSIEQNVLLRLDRVMDAADRVLGCGSLYCYAAHRMQPETALTADESRAAMGRNRAATSANETLQETARSNNV